MASKYWLIGLLVLIGIHLYLLFSITFFPYPELFVYSYLTKHGLIPYQQIFDQHFPGVVFFPINIATLGIDEVFEYRILHLVIVAATQILLFVVARKVFKSYILSLVACFLYLVWQPLLEGYVLWIDSFVPPLLLGAYYFLLDKENKKSLFLSGLLMGFSLLFKQVVGPLIILIGIYLLYKERSIKKIIPFAFGVLLPVSYLLVWVTHLGIWEDFWYWTVIFNVTTFAQMGRTYPTLGQLIRIMPIYGVTAAGLLYLIYKNRIEHSDKSEKLTILLLSIFFCGSLLFSYARFDYVHLQPGLVFAILIITYTVFRWPIVLNWKYFIVPIYVLITLYLLIPFYQSHLGRGTVFFSGLERRITEKVLEYARPGDSTFALGTTPHLYYLTQTLPPSRMFVFQFPWFMVEAEDRVLDGIKADPPKVIVRDVSAEVQDMKLIDYMKNINSYIEENYKVVDDVEGTEIMIQR